MFCGRLDKQYGQAWLLDGEEEEEEEGKKETRTEEWKKDHQLISNGTSRSSLIVTVIAECKLICKLYTMNCMYLWPRPRHRAENVFVRPSHVWCQIGSQIHGWNSREFWLVLYWLWKGEIRLDGVQVFLGDQCVGKTSIITRFMYDKFDNTYQVIYCYSLSNAILLRVASMQWWSQDVFVSAQRVR